MVITGYQWLSTHQPIRRCWPGSANTYAELQAGSNRYLAAHGHHSGKTHRTTSSGSVRSVFIYQCVPGYEEHQRAALSQPRWKSWPWRIRATAAGPCARSLYAKPKSLPQHPQLEGYSLRRVCSAASALCPHIEALISAPWLFSPSSSVWFLFSRQFVVSFLPLFVFGRTRLLLLRDREQEGQGSRCGYTRKSPISCCRLS